MPLIRIALRAGKPAGYRRAIADNVYKALRETFLAEAKLFRVIRIHFKERLRDVRGKPRA